MSQNKTINKLEFDFLGITNALQTAHKLSLLLMMANIVRIGVVIGPLKSSPTISYGVCGIANPDSRQQFTQTTIVYEAAKEASTAAALGLSFISLIVALFW